MVLVTNIYGEAAQVEETLSSLRFASRMQMVATEPAINEKYDAEVLMAHRQASPCGGGVWVCCLGYVGLAPLPAPNKGAIPGQPLSILG